MNIPATGSSLAITFAYFAFVAVLVAAAPGRGADACFPEEARGRKLDLSLDLDDPSMKSSGVWHQSVVYFQQGSNRRHGEQGSGTPRPTFLAGEDPAPTGKSWKPVLNLSDDFTGDSLDASKWQSEPVGNGWGWYGRAPGLFKAANVSLKNGKLCVTVSKLDSPVVKGGKTFTHQGAIVRSRHPGKPGWYFECRMKANSTVMSSTFWLLTKPGNARKLELDIQECVGLTSSETELWATKWDRIFHSNLIDWNKQEKVQLQNSVPTATKNCERYYVYGAWWKSPSEVRFYLDGKYVYSIQPKVEWDEPSYIQMAIETYDWNPIPEDGGLVDTGTWEQRTTQYDWVRVWELVD